jgi:Family of unknown function (DUF6152)
MRSLTTSIFAIVFSLVFLPIGAEAHHSFAATFEAETVAELEGEVMSVQWRNPHVLFTLKVSDAEGKETLYDIESHSLSIMRRMDISPNALKVGDRIRVAGHPARRTDNAMFVLNALLPSGQEIVFDPFGAPRWGENIGTTKVWQATEGDAGSTSDGIFGIWITSVTHPDAWLFPEAFDLSLIANYPLTDEAQAALAAFDPLTDIPTLNCAAKGMPTIMEQPYPMEFVEDGDRILLRLEEYDTLRTIHMTETPAPVGNRPSDLGYSTGHWEGGTLVVKTTNIRYPFFDSVGVPLSGEVDIVERFTPSDDGSQLKLEMTVTDPATFTEPVHIGKTWLAISGVQVEPYECTK